MNHPLLRCGGFTFSLQRPLIMGVLNVTPDSFSDGARYENSAAAVRHAHQMVAEGADMIDIGGESTRPGAMPVDTQSELARVLPVLRELRGCGAALSVDTQKPEVMRAAVDAGVDLINDVNALRAPGALEAVANTEIGLCIMHKQGAPQTMQSNPVYDDVVTDVKYFLQQRMAALAELGVATERVIIDPGFGFGKTLEHNIALLRGLKELVNIGVPVLVGLSRKSMLGKITGADVHDRLPASLAAAIYGVLQGAAIVRVHDVAPTKQALQLIEAIR